MAGAKALIPANRFYGPVTFDSAVTMLDTVDIYDRLWLHQIVSGVREALKLTGANALANVIYWEDFFLNPGYVLPTAAGDAMLGDRRRAFRQGEIFTPDFQTLTAADNISVNAAGIQLGHGSGAFNIYAGDGVPSAVHPVTTGVPPNAFYFNYTAVAANTRLYHAEGGAWVALAA
jgi:hypothetical protein